MNLERPLPDMPIKKENLFAPGDMVRHRKGGEYAIIGRCTFEPTMTDCYAYRGEGGRMWVRPVEQMEDGRFTLIYSGQDRRTYPLADDWDGSHL